MGDLAMWWQGKSSPASSDRHLAHKKRWTRLRPKFCIFLYGKMKKRAKVERAKVKIFLNFKIGLEVQPWAQISAPLP
jgi:hypothetical protein